MNLIERRRQMMMSKSLPYDAEIEYLESTGTSGFYINTGISKPSSFQNATIITEVQFLSTSERQIHGAVNSFYVGVNNKRWECAYTIYRGTADMNRHTLKKYLGLNSNRKQMIISIDDSDLYSSTNTWSNNDWCEPLGIFNINDNSNIGYHARVFSEKIIVNDILVRDFIPVRVGQVGYMYDKVSGQLFGNQGTGNFILGPDK